MKIVHVIPYMHPAAGGPPVVVDRLSRELAACGHDVRVLTTDLFAGGDRAWAIDKRPYELDVFPALAGNGYAFSIELWKAIAKTVRECDVVHLHTLWTFATLAAARACLAARIPYLVMPHGMLDPHSVQRGWLKKQCYGRMLEWPLLRRARGMCYTHTEEERLAQSACPGLPPGHIIELGAESAPDSPRSDLRTEFFDRHPELRDRTVILFLGRIHAKKGLDLLIPAFERVHRQQADAHLLIVGPGEPDYVASIRQDVVRHGRSVRVTFTGNPSGRDKMGGHGGQRSVRAPIVSRKFCLGGSGRNSKRPSCPLESSSQFVERYRGRGCRTRLRTHRRSRWRMRAAGVSPTRHGELPPSKAGALENIGHPF